MLPARMLHRFARSFTALTRRALLISDTAFYFRRQVGLTAIFWSAGIILVLSLSLFSNPIWRWYQTNRDDIRPIGTFAAAALVAWAALRQAKMARLRHEAQTEADRQRRITESFSKAAELLGSDKLEVRLGGIYTMERISRESQEDYWPVMETLTAYVRERARWKQPKNEDNSGDETRGRSGDNQISTDISAVLSVIFRRDKVNHEREKKMGWSFDLRGTDLKGAVLIGASLEGACLNKACLEEAFLNEAHLEHAFLWEAHLERAHLQHVHLEGAYLEDAHLERADLWEAHVVGCANLRKANLEHAILEIACLQGAILSEANLKYANLRGARLEGANLVNSHMDPADLREVHLERANLFGANLEGADLRGAYLENANLWGANLEGACLRNAHLEGVDFVYAIGLEESQLSVALADSKTRLPESVARPATWPAAER